MKLAEGTEQRIHCAAPFHVKSRGKAGKEEERA